MTRRVVHKITPVRQSSFDQQFWPVLVALTVLTGIAVGAIVTVFHGPWMWSSLLLLPILSAFAIFLLFNLDNATLRRSLQFAIILSLSLHLFLLVFASVVNIFQNPFKPSERQVAQRPKVRTIEISDQRALFVWEESNAHETPEPEVEPEKQVQPTTNVKPQPIPVPETKPELNPQLTKRETTSESVPRQNRELSKLKRQTRDLQPQSSQQNTGDKLATNKTATTSAKPTEELKSSKQADAVARQSAPVADSQPESAKAAAAPESTTKQEVARTSSSPRRANPAQPPAESAPLASASTARVRRSTPNMPVASKQAPTIEKLATTTTPTDSEPAKSANQTTRRPEQSKTISPSLANRPKTELSPRAQVARSSERRAAARIQPSISNEASTTLTPRRSTREAQVAASPMSFEKPSRSPESKTASRELNSKTLSVSRSTEGVAGVGRSKNLDRFVGGMTSPASRASDSARRERTQSTPNESRMLSSSQKSDARRSIGSNRRPTSAFKAETSSAAKIAGVKNPGERSLESSAAKVESASTAHRDEISAEKGDAAVDLGPTKVVMDRESLRRSGGGQPEVSQLNPESTRPSKERSQQQPSLLAATGLDVVAPRNPSSASPSSESLEASEQSVSAAKPGGESAITAQRRSAEIAGQVADQGKSNLAQSLADSRARASRFQDESSWDVQKDDAEGENPGGTKRTRIAQAPVVRSDPGTGLAQSDGRSTKQADQPGDSPSESLATKVARQTNAAIPGSGIGRSAANVLIQAATSLPIIEASNSRRKGSSRSTNTDPDLNTGLANRPNPRASKSKTPNVTPSLSGSPDSSFAMNKQESGSGESRELDSTSVTVARTDLAASEQIQGSKLDVIADEGPAGLGIRPDDFIGVMTRPSARDSEQLQPNLDSRFRSPRFGGTPAVNPDAVIARDAFRNRNPASRNTAAEPTTEAAIHLGLEFLARHQSADGSWSLTGFDREAPQHQSQLDSDTAATGLALLAFQGAGYNHREFKYARQIDLAIQWLIENQAEDGGLYVPTDNRSNGACRLYSHGIAALALTEAYGMTQDVRLKEPAQKALDYISSSQDPRKGGWRYFDVPGKKSSDTSVSGWMMMAMQSGRLAGLDVDPDCFDSIEDWLDVAADPEDASRYRYNPFAEDSKGVSRKRQGRTPTTSMTSVGLLMRIYSGWDRDDPRLLAGADFLLTQLPSDSAPLLRDTYYWYYATQVIKHIDGPRWKTWNDRLRPLLTRSQEKTGELAGSWHPYKPVPDRWGQFGGRIYVTTMNLLSLEVRHRMLPLYNQGKPKKLGGLMKTTPRIVSTSWTPKPKLGSRNATLARKPPVGPGTTRANKPKPPRRPLTLGLFNPSTMPGTIQPRRSNNRLPTIDVAIQPSEFESPIGSANLVEPIVEPASTQRETTLLANRFSRLDIDGVQLTPKQPIHPSFKPSTKGNIDAIHPVPDLYQFVALKSFRKLQPRIPRLTGAVPKIKPAVPGWTHLPTLDAPIQPIANELQLSATSLAEPVSALSTIKPDTAFQANIFSRTGPSNVPNRAKQPLLSTNDRPAIASRVAPRRSNPESEHSITLQPESRKLRPRTSKPTAPVSMEQPLIVDSSSFPVFDSQIQSIESESQISDTMAESVTRLSAETQALDSQVGNLSRVRRSGSKFESETLTRSPIERSVQSSFANKTKDQLRYPPIEPIGFEPNSNRPLSRNPQPSAPIQNVLPIVAMPEPVPSNPSPIPPGSQFASASGIITLDGEVLKDATIELIPMDIEDGNPISVRTDTSGQFKFAAGNPTKQAGLKVGKYKVSITTFVESPDANVIDFLETVPAKYNSETKLVISISPDGPNVFDLKLVLD